MKLKNYLLLATAFFSLHSINTHAQLKAKPKYKSVKKTTKPKSTAVSFFRRQLNAMARTAGLPGGFESMKQTEVATGMWTCNRDLEGFLPMIQVQAGNPNDRLILSATSVDQRAQTHVKDMELNGLPGFQLKDSDQDKSLQFDRTKYNRIIKYTRTDKVSSIVVTLYFLASNKAAAYELTIEGWQPAGF